MVLSAQVVAERDINQLREQLIPELRQKDHKLMACLSHTVSEGQSGQLSDINFRIKSRERAWEMAQWEKNQE